jgi:nickel superoxide dismutase
MKKTLFLKAACVFTFALSSQLSNLQAHCQMPCGIYHDDMVFDLIDQYVETMIKAVSMLNQSKFETVREKNEFVRWVLEKDKESDDAAKLITTFFMQQKIKPGEADTAKRLESAHKLLCLLVSIKQNADLKIVESFGDEWEKFKLMFHVEGYECKIEQIKMKKRQALLMQQQEHDHDHDHEHGDHDHHH